MLLFIYSCQLYCPIMDFPKSLRIIFKRKRLLTQLPVPCIDCPGIMCLTANVTTNNQHVIADKRKFIIFAEFPMNLKSSLGIGFRLTAYAVCFFYHLLLFLYIHHRIDLIVCSFCFTIHFKCLLFFLILPTRQVSNNLNLLEVFSLVNSLI